MSASVRSADGTLTLPGRTARSRTAAGDTADAPAGCPAGLWGRRDVVQLVALSAVGAVLMGVAWYASGDGRPLDRQMARLDLAVGGLLIGVCGGGMFLLHGLRAVAARKAAVKALAARRVDARAAGRPRAAAGELVAGPAMTRYHRSGCSLVTGKPVAPATRAEHERAGRRPCGVCVR